MTIEPLGDAALLLRLGDQIDEAVQRQVWAISARIRKNLPAGALEVVPAFTTLAIHYDPLQIRYTELADRLLALATNLDDAADIEPARTITIPVQYGGAGGPDLAHVAQAAGMSVDEVIRFHSRVDYLVHMIGFAPGFAYLGGLDPRIACARRASPRTHVPAGSVAIGGNQTAVYPIDSPGGWQIIGHTDVTLFDPDRNPAALLRAGDRVRFTVIEP